MTLGCLDDSSILNTRGSVALGTPRPQINGPLSARMRFLSDTVSTGPRTKLNIDLKM